MKSATILVILLSALVSSAFAQQRHEIRIKVGQRFAIVFEYPSKAAHSVQLGDCLRVVEKEKLPQSQQDQAIELVRERWTIEGVSAGRTTVRVVVKARDNGFEEHERVDVYDVEVQ